MGEWDVAVTLTDGDSNETVMTFPASRKVTVK